MSAALRDKFDRRAGWYRFMEIDFAADQYGFPANPALSEAFTADDGSKWELNKQHIWELMSYAPDWDDLLAAVRERDNTIARVRDVLDDYDGLDAEPIPKLSTHTWMHLVRAALDPQETP